MVARGCLAIVLAGLALSLAPVAYADEGCDRHHDGDGHDHPETCRAAASAAMVPARVPAVMPTAPPRAPGPAPTPAVREHPAAPPLPSPAVVTPPQPEAVPAATVAATAGLTVLALLAGALLARRRLAPGAGPRQ